MAERVEHDVSEATHALAKVVAAPERKNGAWVGGSIFASTPDFEQFQIKGNRCPWNPRPSHNIPSDAGTVSSSHALIDHFVRIAHSCESTRSVFLFPFTVASTHACR
jgi:hypothetical protein